jgi:protein tyrosine phosphatase (PTP) superfamily phosphohydrolase (DUF442 family)
MRKRFGIFVLGLVMGAAGMFLLDSYWTGRWPFGGRAVDIGFPDRPGKWAECIYEKDLPNFHKVSDELYRGAQPGAEGMARLEELGIKTVVNLRKFHSDRDELEGTDLGYERITMTALTPDEGEVVDFLKVVTDKKKTPVFVHCRHGSDRTGLMCAVYRVFVQGWTKEEAIREMRDGGYGFHSAFQNLLRFLEDLDVESVRERIGRD